MPRKEHFNKVWEYSARKTAKNNKRGGGGRFTKIHALNCEKVCAAPIHKTVVRNGSEPDYGVRLHANICADINPCGMNVATWLDQLFRGDAKSA
jgi:hypothetical protein